jgi:hypothetical protein
MIQIFIISTKELNKLGTSIDFDSIGDCWASKGSLGSAVSWKAFNLSSSSEKPVRSQFVIVTLQEVNKVLANELYLWSIMPSIWYQCPISLFEYVPCVNADWVSIHLGMQEWE